MFILFLFLFQKSRKIFDPADHEAPSRKRKISSPTPPMLLAADQQQQDMLKPLQLEAGMPNGNNPPALSPGPVSAGGGTALVQPKKEVDGEVCMYCGQGNQKKSTLIRCKDCPTIGNKSKQVVLSSSLAYFSLFKFQFILCAWNTPRS